MLEFSLTLDEYEEIQIVEMGLPVFTLDSILTLW